MEQPMIVPDDPSEQVTIIKQRCQSCGSEINESTDHWQLLRHQDQGCDGPVIVVMSTITIREKYHEDEIRDGRPIPAW